MAIEREQDRTGYLEGRAGTYLEGYPPENGTKQSVAQSTGQTAERKRRMTEGRRGGAG